MALAETAWQTADREDDDGGAFMATYAGIALCFGLHDFKEAMRWAQRELGKPRTAQSPFRRESIAQLMSNNTARLGDLTEARRLSPHSDRRFFRASLLLFEGQWEEAEELFESEIVESRSVGNLLEVSNCNSILAILLRVRGAARQASLALGEAVAEIGEANVRSEMQMRPALSRAHAELGQYDAAEQELARCREILAAGEDWRGMSGDVGLAAAVLAAARGRYQEAEGEFDAALSIFCRYSAPWEEADTLECWASALVAAGDRARAAEKFDAAIEVYRRIGAPERWIERVTSMRERAVAATGSEDSASASEIGRHPASATLRCNGDYWIVSDGGTTAHLKDMKGLHYIRQLLRHPGEELHVLDLIGRGLDAGDVRDRSEPRTRRGPARPRCAGEERVPPPLERAARGAGGGGRLQRHRSCRAGPRGDRRHHGAAGGRRGPGRQRSRHRRRGRARTVDGDPRHQCGAPQHPPQPARARRRAGAPTHDGHVLRLHARSGSPDRLDPLERPRLHSCEARLHASSGRR